jgi:predicted SAM-dependent methyltransferase
MTANGRNSLAFSAPLQDGWGAASGDSQMTSESTVVAPDKRAPRQRRSFSLNRLQRDNPGLANQYLWDTNPDPRPAASGPLWLHVGCGARVFDGFVNLDICPQDLKVIKWDLLDFWPQELANRVDGFYSEDCIEHFFRGEQTYILCNMNYTLKAGGVSRVLMPSLPKLLKSSASLYPIPNSFLSFLKRDYGVEKPGDAFNYLMRFTGHRWLHDVDSLRYMANSCGFACEETACAYSVVRDFCARNLRSEFDSVSFAVDLTKTDPVSRHLVRPTRVHGAEKVEDLPGDAELFRATDARPIVEYELQERFNSDRIACVNFRSSNTSTFDWNTKYLCVNGGEEEGIWGFDETLKSRACMNVVTRDQLNTAFGKSKQLQRLLFKPAYQPGEYFTLGVAEIFFLS